MKLQRVDANGDLREEVEIHPGKILGIGTNYRAHAVEMGKSVADEPLIFLKPSTSVIGPGEAICRPRGYDRVDFEGELGVVIGQLARRVSAADAHRYIMGYTCVNDVTVRDLQKRDSQWARAKGFDTFCPIGPRIVSGIEPGDLRIVTRQNGQLRQDSLNSDMVFSVPELIEVITRVMTLEVGDVITTGTPSGVAPIAPGDLIEIDIEHIGTLSNPVVDEP